MRPMQPDGLPHRMKPKVTAPESTFTAEEAKLQKLKQDLLRQDFYSRLGLTLGATPEEARKALLGKTKDFHPDNKPDALKPIYGEIFALYTEASNALGAKKETPVKVETNKAPRQEQARTPIEEFKHAFQIYRMMDVPQNIPPQDTFNMVKNMYVKNGKITEEEAEELKSSILSIAA